MDDNINQIKKQILSELGYLSYMDKQKIRDDLDQAYIKKELEQIKKRNKYRIVSIVLIHISIIAMMLSVFFDKTPIVSKQNIFGTVTSIITFLLLINLVISQSISITKRETLFKVLSVFNK